MDLLGVSALHHRCRWCGRRLTDPDSRLRGAGPVCWRHLHPRRPRPIWSGSDVERCVGQHTITGIDEYLPILEISI
jgi:hypothetical protein